jgi:membrane protease subunit (stomatin/prohibitin family)
MKAAMPTGVRALRPGLDNFAVESISLPEELQKALDTRISMGMVGDLGKYTQYQVAPAFRWRRRTKAAWPVSAPGLRRRASGMGQ